jgi:hypothetical protein
VIDYSVGGDAMTILDDRPAELLADPSLIHVEVPTAQTTWGELDAFLGDRDERPEKGRRMTRIRRVTPGSMFGPIAVRYWHTDIVVAHVDGTVTLNTDGWRTMTTKERMNDYLPGFHHDDATGEVRAGVQLYAHKGTWKLSRFVHRFGLRREWPEPDDDYAWLREDVSDFYDGITLDARGMVVGEVIFHTGDPDAEVKAKIRAYVAGYTDDEITRLVLDARENGTAGDCWFCAMRTEDGTTWGDTSGDDSHLMEHLDEDYRMASLLLNACEARGYGDPGYWLASVADYGRGGEVVRANVRTYLTKKLAHNTTGARPTGAVQRGWYGAA